MFYGFSLATVGTMHYVIIASDDDDSSALRMANRPTHLARLIELDSQGHLHTAGALPVLQEEDISSSDPVIKNKSKIKGRSPLYWKRYHCRIRINAGRASLGGK